MGGGGWRRGSWYAAGVLAVGAMFRCNTVPLLPFDYNGPHHRLPRVSVIHRPLHPAAGDAITLSAVVEPAANTTVNRISISFLRSGQTTVTHDCTGQVTCDFVVTAPPGATPGYVIYSASVEDSAGARAYTPTAYGFHVGPPPAPSMSLHLRVPLRTAGPWRVLLVRDGPSYPNDADLWNDAEHFLYDQLLVDPAWRWRDNQLAFYYLLVPGVTTDYYSAVSTRCGQDPWPTTSTPADVWSADAVGVIHRRPNFRDCSGLGIVTTGAAPRRNFAANGTEPRVVQHEMGHALFGLGDEYWEDETSRRAPGVPPDPTHCVCCDENGRRGWVDANGNIVFSSAAPAGTPAGRGPAPVAPLPMTGGGLGTLTGVGTVGTAGTFGGLAGLGGAAGTGGTTGTGGTISLPCTGPPCSTWTPPPDCRLVAPLCPPLGGWCREPNDFASLAECQTQATKIAAHRGIETQEVAASCRKLCGPGFRPCPCVPSTAEVWIIDREHPPLANSTGDDIMATVPPSLLFNGGACELCLETTFCLRWEIGLGISPGDAEAWCAR